MSTSKKPTEIELLEQYRVAFENVTEQSEIATVMAEFGYDAETITAGKQKYDHCRSVYDLNQLEDQETNEAYALFDEKRDQLMEEYKLHRKKAKIVFRKEAGIMAKLQIDGQTPRSYLKLMESMKVFYQVLLSDESLQSAVAELNMGIDQLTATNNLIAEVEAARVEYLREEGESQDATKQKDAAFAEIDDWMHDFYAVARIALDEHPQLLEALGILVRS